MLKGKTTAHVSTAEALTYAVHGAMGEGPGLAPLAQERAQE